MAEKWKTLQNQKCAIAKALKVLYLNYNFTGLRGECNVSHFYIIYFVLCMIENKYLSRKLGIINILILEFRTHPPANYEKMKFYMTHIYLIIFHIFINKKF